MTEIVNPLIINEIRVLWSDYLHDYNPELSIDYVDNRQAMLIGSLPMCEV